MSVCMCARTNVQTSAHPSKLCHGVAASSNYDPGTKCMSVPEDLSPPAWDVFLFSLSTPQDLAWFQGVHSWVDHQPSYSCFQNPCPFWFPGAPVVASSEQPPSHFAGDSDGEFQGCSSGNRLPVFAAGEFRTWASGCSVGCSDSSWNPRCSEE